MSQPLVQIINLSWQYGGSGTDTWALRDVSLNINPGERIGVVGRSGSGKSTLGLCLNGLVPQSHAGTQMGRVLVAGLDTATTPVSVLSGYIAMMFQSPDAQMSQMLAGHEVASGAANRNLPDPNGIAERVMTRLGILNFRPRLTFSLSGGEKQKIALAAALAMQPEFLVLDEPTTDLDPVSKTEIVELLAQLETGFLIISHDLEAILPLVDRLIVMDGGRLIADGAAMEIAADTVLLERCGIAQPAIVTFNHQLNRRIRSWPVTTGLTTVLELLDHRYRGNGECSTQPVGSKPAVSLCDVSYRYPGADRDALKNVNITVNTGELVAVIGNNGSGKTTLSKMITGLLKPASGEIRVAGRLVTGVHPGSVGYVFQNPFLMMSQLTVADEISFTPKCMGCRDWREITQRMLQQFGLEALRAVFPLSLSQGQCQKLAYASVLGSDPQVLVFDEPTTGIDKPGVAQIMTYMNGLKAGGKTILFITHDMNLAFTYADRIVVMHDGQVLAEAAPQELLEADETLYQTARISMPVTSQIARALGLPAVSDPVVLAEKAAEVLV